MRIDRAKYKGLKFLEDNATCQVVNNPTLINWMKELCYDGEGGIPHVKCMSFIVDALRSRLRSNINYIAQPVVELAKKNYERMFSVVKEEWLKDTNGVLLMPDGSMYIYVVMQIDNASEEVKAVVGEEAIEREQCKGGAYLLYINKDGLLDNADFITTRLWFEGDGTRKVMHDTPFLEVADEMFCGLMCLLGFLQYADTEKVVLENGQKKKHEREVIQNNSGVKVNYIDSRYFREIIRTEGYVVHGFWRMQACGQGRKDRKLIYVNDFMKHGYHRRALKDIK